MTFHSTSSSTDTRSAHKTCLDWEVLAKVGVRAEEAARKMGVSLPVAQWELVAARRRNNLRLITPASLADK